ncbi:MAG: TIGR03768 family metallophosphoesterase [Desulfatibacillum sp.]|nr:TIGR03768 family metallophosphoesterase [Desulfatibacillum sp.]
MFGCNHGGCIGGYGDAVKQVLRYPIDSPVLKTTGRMITFPYVKPSDPSPKKMPDPADPATSPNGGTALTWAELSQVPEYDKLGYGQWEYLDQPLPIVPRMDIMPTGYDASSIATSTKLLNFFAMTDIHLTDKEAPNQLIFMQQSNPDHAGVNTSIYSGVMLYSPHVFDAAIQTANALHKENPFDFFISLGDACNTTMYNELRWYLDIIDGKVIVPCSGAHLGADTVDYQKPFKAAGLDKSIPFYQTLGNHDHFMIGSFPVYETGLEDSYISDKVWALPNELLSPKLSKFPALFDKNNLTGSGLPLFYQGVIDGSTPDGAIINSGPEGDYSTPPKVAADPDRRSLHREEWIREFFKTTTSPMGHGFNLVSSNPNFHLVPDGEKAGFACYSFEPKSDLPLKVIVLDDTQREDDGSVDIHGHGFLDDTRWAWLQAELDDGQAANQLMIIAAHIPIAVANRGTELEWWTGKEGDESATTDNAVDLTGLVNKLQSTTNLLMWIAGHRHLNHVKAFVSPDPDNEPEKGFWQVETSSLRDFPQQFRTFEILLNSDYSVSIEAVNVDPAIAEGTPAAKSRRNAIAAQQIVHGNLTMSAPNYETFLGKPIPPTDPTQPQSGEQITGVGGVADPSIQYQDLTSRGIPYNASYNARLFKQLSPAMKAHMQKLFPAV